MKKNTEDQKPLKLDVETVRHLQTEELDKVVGAEGAQAAAAGGITLSVSLLACGCVC